MLQLFDETGLSPIEPGILVYLSANQTQDQFIDIDGDTTQAETAYTLVGGYVGFELSAGTSYTVTFRDTTGAAIIGPPASTSVTFVGAATGDTAVSVAGFISPSHPLSVYATLAEGLMPTGFFSDPGTAPILESLLTGLAASTALLDEDTQLVIASERPQMCEGPQLDSFAADFFGPYLLRYPETQSTPEESDADYYARILLGFGPRCTPPVLQSIVDHYFQLNPTFGSSGYLLFDTYSDPERAAYYGLVQADAQFALLEYFPPTFVDMWFIGQPPVRLLPGGAPRATSAFLGQNTFIEHPLGYTKYTVIPYPELAAEIDRARAKGTVPIYISSLGDPYS